jgi:hypothetical protein
MERMVLAREMDLRYTCTDFYNPFGTKKLQLQGKRM